MKTNNDIQNPKLITDDDIVSAARHLSDEQNEALAVPPEFRTAKVAPLRPKAWKRWAAAACVGGFLAGFGTSKVLALSADSQELRATLDTQGSVKIDTMLLREVIHDTVFQTRIIVQTAVPKIVVAKASAEQKAVAQELQQEDEPVAVGCSMLCDDIAYELLAGN